MMTTRKDDDGPHPRMGALFRRPTSAYEACVQRHERVRIALLAAAVLSIFLSDVLFFMLHTILPLIVVTILSIFLYMYVNKRLRSIEKQIATQV